MTQSSEVLQYELWGYVVQNADTLTKNSLNLVWVNNGSYSFLWVPWGLIWLPAILPVFPLPSCLAQRLLQDIYTACVSATPDWPSQPVLYESHEVKTFRSTLEMPLCAHTHTRAHTGEGCHSLTTHILDQLSERHTHSRSYTSNSHLLSHSPFSVTVYVFFLTFRCHISSFPPFMLDVHTSINHFSHPFSPIHIALHTPTSPPAVHLSPCTYPACSGLNV